MEIKGKLFVVPTPIGNLKDMTFRAVEVLQQVDYILAEDTRTSRPLLQNFNISTNLKSYHAHNEHSIIQNIIQDLLDGKNIALISDAGTPAISDPGYLIVKQCIDNQIPVECLPGATAFVPALVCSGMPLHHFVFFGFLPVKKGRQSKLQELAQCPYTKVLYESPHKFLKTLEDLKNIFGGEKEISISREISKKFEEHLRGSIDEMILHFQQHEPRGEFVIVI
ncbi:MAG: ribosomal RNA small subunit methyltransferase I [Bacteroidia bacterium]|nr:MAG: ribosomal RNA small subunit methyltransferase I [Bacteroidia bacterium]